jgi:hypothetical protein
MITGTFYVKLRNMAEEQFREKYPDYSEVFSELTKFLQDHESYPVLAVDRVESYAAGKKIIKTLFLVPGDNGNFAWILSDWVEYVGVSGLG